MARTGSSDRRPRMGRPPQVAGVLRNTGQHGALDPGPQAIVPGNAMPDMGISDDQARDMAAFLDTLRQIGRAPIS